MRGRPGLAVRLEAEQRVHRGHRLRPRIADPVRHVIHAGVWPFADISMLLCVEVNPCRKRHETNDADSNDGMPKSDGNANSHNARDSHKFQFGQRFVDSTKEAENSTISVFVVARHGLGRGLVSYRHVTCWNLSRNRFVIDRFRLELAACRELPCDSVLIFTQCFAVTWIVDTLLNQFHQVTCISASCVYFDRSSSVDANCDRA